MQPYCHQVLQRKYALDTERGLPGNRLRHAILERVAQGLAQTESRPEQWVPRFKQALEQGFIPAGRILYGAGRPEADRYTLINCFVQPLAASEHGLTKALEQAATTLQAGGGVGYDFSPMTPEAGERQGPGVLEALSRCNRLSDQLTGPRHRQGAQMGVLRVDHPDVLRFIQAKREVDQLTHFNISVGVTDEFMLALRNGKRFALRHAIPPRLRTAGKEEKQGDQWVYQWVDPETIWQALIRNSYENAEPGVLFLDTLQRENNLQWLETLVATNPCGEQPLPAFGACCLGSIDVTHFVRAPFSQQADLDIEQLRFVTQMSVRMLDNVLDVSHWPLPEQQQEAMAKRRIGLGITGLGDALAMLGLLYDTQWARDRAEAIMTLIRDAAYQASVSLAQEKGAFPLFNAHYYMQSDFIQRLPESLQDEIRQHGLRNSHILSIAPAGSISIAMADNVSNGIEPIFQTHYKRKQRQEDGGGEVWIEDHAYRLFRAMHRHSNALPRGFVAAEQISPIDHVDMVATLSPLVDSAISKTINVPEQYPLEKFQNLYRYAWQLGVKGITVYRAGSSRGYVLASK